VRGYDLNCSTTGTRTRYKHVVYQLRLPATELSRYIESYWFVGADGQELADLRVDVYVDGRADLIFNFGDPYVREVIGGRRAAMSKSNLDAQRLVPIRITQRGRLRTTGVRFRLGGVGPFSLAPLNRFTGGTPAPFAVFGNDVIRLEGCLRGTLDADGQKILLDDFFCKHLVVPRAFPAFEAALQRAVEARGAAKLEALADAAGATSRHVERLFARFLGIAPRSLARVLRFQTALQALMHDTGFTLAAVAAEAGYFDQAHFVRDFREMTGGVPRGYRGYFPPAGPTDFAPNVVVFVQDDDC
jgi:AraC-like DNA-binding protein